MKAFQVVGSFHNLQISLATLLGPSHQLARVTAVRPDQLQLLVPISDSLEDQLGPVTVLNPGRVDDNGKNQAHHINQQMSLTPADLLASVISIGPTLLVRLGRLAVDDSSSRFDLAARLSPNLVSERLMDQFPGAVALPATEVIIDGPSRREIMGDQMPGAPGTKDVEDGVDDLAHVGGPRSAAAGFGKNERGDQFPLGIGQVRSVALSSRGRHDVNP